MADKKLSIDFDDFTESYESLLKEQLSFFSTDRGYFSSYKARLVARLLPSQPARILDFGCGIGLNLPHLAASFPGSELCATDISAGSLDHVRQRYPGVRILPDGALEDSSFDLIFVAGVFHHIPMQERPGVIKRLASLLAPGGALCVFEHNPYNPMTRYLVATCPFDTDAVLETRRRMRQLFVASARLDIRRDGYCLFFPPSLKALTRLEPALAWLPLGGQYFVLGGK